MTLEPFIFLFFFLHRNFLFAIYRSVQPVKWRNSSKCWFSPSRFSLFTYSFSISHIYACIVFLTTFLLQEILLKMSLKYIFTNLFLDRLNFLHWKIIQPMSVHITQNSSLKQEREPSTLTFTERLIPQRTHKWFLSGVDSAGKDRQAWPHYRLFINILFVAYYLKQTTSS